MTLYLAGASALEYWRTCPPTRARRARAVLPFGSPDVGDAGFRVADLAALADAGLGWLSPPVRLLVPRALSRRRCPRAAFHVCSRALPEGSFVRASRDVMVSSPELACVQAASSTSFPLFVELLYELCGHYRLPQGRAGEMVAMPPAANVASLASFADRAQGLRGAAALKRAVRYVCDDSLSPMETDAAETMVLDPRMGGFGLARPQLNRRFEVARKDRRALPQSTYLPDLYWPQANISVEYESDKHHRGERKMAEDAVRRNGIEHLGTRVVSLTWGQARNYYEFERVALLVADALGKKFGSEWDRWAERRIALHRLLVRR